MKKKKEEFEHQEDKYAGLGRNEYENKPVMSPFLRLKMYQSERKYSTEEREILNVGSEYCSKRYNHEINGDPAILNCHQTETKLTLRTTTPSFANKWRVLYNH